MDHVSWAIKKTRWSFLQTMICTSIGWEGKLYKMFRIYADYAEAWATGFQDPASDWMYAIIDLHDRIIFYLLIVLAVVVWFLVSSMLNTDHMAHLHHGNALELLWTITPAVILWAIGLPSLRLLYMMDEILDPELSVKVMGSQWFWSYEYSDYVDNGVSIAFDSFMVSDADLELGDLRTLAVDNYLVLPINTSIRLLISSNDVIHSFALPSLAIKADAIPGRLNSTGLIINRPSTFYGQCSELCGVLHG
uniref:cytochrome c oxidase subunit 2 n=1 Tax=Spizellomyces sp. 'palustris' TaxID=117820 RepID=UPI0010FBE359|nr:cytochrome c oxidase subunit 2 [Spizellomyces sp. 'palustris']QCQ69026.1 cytochrome c oxidase subunit 2 [Spizellomyces sp. 'palustris']